MLLSGVLSAVCNDVTSADPLVLCGNLLSAVAGLLFATSAVLTMLLSAARLSAQSAEILTLLA
jgi:hypothetical protein